MPLIVDRRELYALFGGLWLAWAAVLGVAFFENMAPDGNGNKITVLGLAVISGFLAGLATVGAVERAGLLRLYSNKNKGRDPRKRPRGAGARA